MTQLDGIYVTHWCPVLPWPPLPAVPSLVLTEPSMEPRGLAGSSLLVHLLHWQVDSLLLNHQGSLYTVIVGSKTFTRAPAIHIVTYKPVSKTNMLLHPYFIL